MSLWVYITYLDSYHINAKSMQLGLYILCIYFNFPIGYDLL